MLPFIELYLHYICAGCVAISRHVKQMFVIFTCPLKSETKCQEFPDVALFSCVSMYSKVCIAGAHSSSVRCSPLWCVYANVCVMLKRIWISKFICVCLCWGLVFFLWELLLVWPPIVRSHILFHYHHHHHHHLLRQKGKRGGKGRRNWWKKISLTCWLCVYGW